MAEAFWRKEGYRGDEGDEQVKPLIPIIYSHGLTSCRTFQSGSCRDLASQGYIVFAIDHHDGTCNYSRLKNGDDKYWTSLINPDDWNHWISRLEVRLVETIGLIDDIQNQEELLQKTLGFSTNAFMDTSRLTVGGHSFGGMSAVYTAFREPRIKAVFGFDAWVWAVLTKVLASKFIVK